MKNTSSELSEIFKSLDQDFIKSLSWDKAKVVEAVINCRTSRLGAHVRSCSNCNYREQSYNSCRNRHCPKCQGSVSAEWTESRNRELLPVDYFHSVFTIPKELRDICYQNKRAFYELMFKTVSESLHAVSSNPKFLGGKIGFITILHTWNQILDYHPHIHVISPKGSISVDKTQWLKPRGNFFLPVRALSKVYRGKLLAGLRELYKQNKLRFFNTLVHLNNPNEFEKLLATTLKSNWVVYSKKSFGGATQVVKYLSSYVHRIAISNHRIMNLDNNEVTFSYRDSRNQNKRKQKTITATKFTHKFLRHILPKNFTRIRHYGFLGSASKRKNLELAKNLILQKQPMEASNSKNSNILPFKMSCPQCHIGELQTVLLSMIPHRSQAETPFSRQFNNDPPRQQPLAA